MSTRDRSQVVTQRRINVIRTASVRLPSKFFSDKATIVLREGAYIEYVTERRSLVNAVWEKLAQCN